LFYVCLHLDKLFEEQASKYEQFKDHFVRKMYPFTENELYGFIQEAFRRSNLTLDEDGCYKSSDECVIVGKTVCEMLKKHHVETIKSLLTYSTGDSIILKDGWRSYIDIAFKDYTKENLRKHLWGTSDALSAILVREALFDALNGVNFSSLNEDDIYGSCVFRTIKYLE